MADASRQNGNGPAPLSRRGSPGKRCDRCRPLPERPALLHDLVQAGGCAVHLDVVEILAVVALTFLVVTEGAAVLARPEAEMLGLKIVGNAQPFVGRADGADLRNLLGEGEGVEDLPQTHRFIVGFSPDPVVQLLVDVHYFLAVAVADRFSRDTPHVD